MFAELAAWFERRRAFGEMRARGGGGDQAYTHYFSEQINVAKQELEVGRREKSLEIWRRMQAQFPDLCLTSDKALSLLIDLGCYDESEALLQEGRKRFPRYRSLYTAAFARVAYRRGDLAEALRRYEAVRRSFPQVADGYGIAAACLTALDRRDEAEAMLERGVRRLPGDFDLWMLFAKAAMQRCDWPEGLRRWNLAWDRFGYLHGKLGAAHCLRELGRLAEAQQVLTEACERFQSNVYPFFDLATLATTKGDFEEAARRWKIVLTRFPGHDPAYPKAAEVLRKIGQEAEADEVLRVGATRFPTNLAINLEYAQSGRYGGDRAAECRRWAMVRERFPNCAEARDQEMAARPYSGEPIP